MNERDASILPDPAPAFGEGPEDKVAATDEVLARDTVPVTAVLAVGAVVAPGPVAVDRDIIGLAVLGIERVEVPVRVLSHAAAFQGPDQGVTGVIIGPGKFPGEGGRILPQL